MVNCRRRNTLRIEELDEDLSAEDYDHRKRDNGMNKAMNAYSSDLRIIKTTDDECNKKFKKLKTSLKKKCPCVKFNMRVLCETATGLEDCHCDSSAESCGECTRGYNLGL